MNASVTYSFSPTTIIASSEVNQNFTDIVNYFNNTASPIGMIVMWSGSIASIPTGWQLCNGSSGTSDLRDKFIIGAGNTYAVDTTGGSTTKNIQHSHSYSGTTAISNDDYTHNPKIRKNSDENYMGHTHAYSGTTANGGSSAQDLSLIHI